MTDAPRIFDALAPRYDAMRRALVPPYERFYGAAVDALSLLEARPRRVLDLGAGTGLLSAGIHAAHPDAELVLLDGAPAMLEQARANLTTPQATFVVGDLRDELPEGPFDAIVSALAIHHLEDGDKRALFARARAALRPGGLFVNAEQVAGPTAWLEHEHHAWHRDSSAALGADADAWLAAEQRMLHDRCATAEDQLRWLAEAGFADADCVFRERRFTVLLARRAP